jgi:thiol-disulfide isomerase/thioredoxin
MKKAVLIIILLVNTVFLADGKFGKVELIKGVPKEVEKQSKSFQDPYHAYIPTNGVFQKVCIVWDKKDSKRYTSIVIYNDNYFLRQLTYFRIHDSSVFTDSTFFVNRDEYKSNVPYQIRLNTEKLELEYYWCQSFEIGIMQEGGVPQFVKPRLCKGKMMPEFNFKTLNGEVISSEKLRGKFVYIDFWGTWCGGCIAEIPNIIVMREKISRDKLFIVGFVKDSPDSLKKYLAKNTFNYPNVIVDKDYLKICEFEQYPFAVLVDPHGKIVSTYFNGEDIWQKVLTEMEKNSK